MANTHSGIKRTDHESRIEIETSTSPNASVIWLHGLGADGNDFVPIVPELQLPASLGLRFIFPHAPVRPVTCNGGYSMRAWYDIYSLENFEQEDVAGLTASQQIINTLIQTENDRGIPTNRIILMGFSQGGALALFSGLHYPQALAGIGALSTYLPGRHSDARYIDPSNQQTPIFMAHGLYDNVVRLEHGETSCAILKEWGCNVDWKTYSMEHAVCLEEISDIANWLVERLA